MADFGTLDRLVAATSVEPSVYWFRPDYRAVLLAVNGIVPGPSDEESDALLSRAEATARGLLLRRPVDQVPHVAAWGDAYRAFGAKKS